MKNAAILLLLLTVLSCREKTYYVEEIDNPKYRKNVAFDHPEDLADTKFESLKVKYQLDTIFHGEQDEFKRILLLRDWIKRTISINDYSDPYPGGGSAEGILDAALKGQGFHCGHYMVVQNAIMNSYGYVTRCLGSGPGVKGADGHHGMNEIWLNGKQKWFLSDAKYNHHFEKNGVPLSALEVRDEYLRNRAADIVMVKGADRKPIESDGLADENGKILNKTRADFAQWYTWLEWDKSNNRYTGGPDFGTRLNMYEDDYSRSHTWLWDGKTHWAFNTAHVDFLDSREAIEWTPNTVQVQVAVTGDSAKFNLASSTPNLKQYEMKESSDGQWRKCDSVFALNLEKMKYELVFRAVNLANVSGPESKVIISSK
jgi:hypothetical protein